MTPLKSLWAGIKAAGAGLMDKLGLGSLGLFKGGLAAFLGGAARIVGPALLLFGGVTALIRVINKLRKKNKMQPLPQNEINKIKDYAERNAAEINNRRIKAGQPVIKLT
jgi:hypothetical protein